MKLLELELTNFKRFQNATIPLNKPLTLLVGPNGSGKTTILEAIGLALRIIPEGSIVYLNKNQMTGTAEIQLMAILSSNEWKALMEVRPFTPTILSNEQIEVLAQKLESIPVRITWTITYRDGVKTSSRGDTNFSIRENITQLDGDSQRVANHVVKQILGVGPERFFGIIYLPPDRQYREKEEFIPFNRLLGEKDRSRFVRNWMLYLKDTNPSAYSTLVGKLTTSFPSITNLDVDLDKNTGAVDFLLKEAGKSFDLHVMGAGTQAFLTLLASALSSTVSILLLDEPDIHLYPGLVTELYRTLKEISKQSQIILTTHDENLINQVEDPSEILSIKKEEALASSVIQLKTFDEKMDLLDDLGIPISLFDRTRIASQRPIVFGEGSSDKEFLEEFALKINKLDQLQNCDMIFKALEGQKNWYRIIVPDVVGALEALSVPFLVFLDSDELKESEKDELIEALGEERVFLLGRREIENYLFDPNAILSLLKFKATQRNQAETMAKLEGINSSIVENKLRAFGLATQRKAQIILFLNSLKPLRINTSAFIKRYVNQDLEQIINAVKAEIFDKLSEFSNEQMMESLTRELGQAPWSGEDVMKRCLGKDVFTEFNKWCESEFQITFSPREIIQHLEAVDNDIINLIDRILELCRQE